jgi:hypothetical protein
MLVLIKDPQIQQIINQPLVPSHVESNMKRREDDGLTINRDSAGEN